MPKVPRKCVLLICAVLVLSLLMLRFVFFNSSDMPLRRQRLSLDAPVLVSVFYEALCTDSKHFIVKQLMPAYSQASAYMDIQLVPYGKATTKVNPDGSYEFDCQHGPAECWANKYHACSIEIVSEAQLRLDLIACMIKDNRLPREAFQRCAKQYLSEEVATSVQKCFDSSLGAELLKLHGEVTHALRPAVHFIPTILLDGSQGHQAAILKDLLAEVCKIIGDTEKTADICRKRN